MRLIFASNNQHKVDEIRHVISHTSVTIVSLKEAGIDIDIPEPFDTLEENATNKSRTIYEMLKVGTISNSIQFEGCFSEDTGLEVEALNSEPGVKSARYAGEHRSFDANIQKLFDKLKGIENRRAQFRTVISLIIAGQEHFFEGVCKGSIIETKKGINGFGYDPVFVPQGSVHTFAEMGMEEKNRFSHRKKATGKLVAFLETRDKN